MTNYDYFKTLTIEGVTDFISCLALELMEQCGANLNQSIVDALVEGTYAYLAADFVDPKSIVS